MKKWRPALGVLAVEIGSCTDSVLEGCLITMLGSFDQRAYCVHFSDRGTSLPLLGFKQGYDCEIVGRSAISQPKKGITLVCLKL